MFLFTFAYQLEFGNNCLLLLFENVRMLFAANDRECFRFLSDRARACELVILKFHIKAANCYSKICSDAEWNSEINT